MLGHSQISSADPLNQIGSIEISGDHDVVEKPAWMIAAKSLAMIGMFAMGFAIIVPSLPFPLWQSIIMALGLMLVYVGICFYIRPEPNTDNMGILGGVIDDPMRVGDNLNRGLFLLYQIMGPGRFVSGTIIDLGVALGVYSLPTPLVTDGAAAAPTSNDMPAIDLTVPDAPEGQSYQSLDSLRYMSSSKPQ